MGDDQADRELRLTVFSALERLRLAEARRARRRQSQSGLIESDRAAMRLVLEADDHGIDVTASLIAARLGLSPASTTALVDRLVDAGLVTVRPHPSDRRKKLIQPIDRSLDPDRLDPLTVRLRDAVQALSGSDALVVQAFLDAVIAAVEDPELPAE